MGIDNPLDELARLHEAGERVSANLVELEIDSGRQLLEATTLEGESARRWSSAGDALSELWRQHGLLGDLLERADGLRGSRHAQELRSLLEGPSIELSRSPIPVAERDLLGESEVAERCSPRELLASMSKGYDEVKAVVAEISAAWERFLPQLDRARRLLDEIRGLAEELSQASALAEAEARVGRLNAAVTADPLSVSPGDLDRLLAELRTVRDELADAVALKRGFESRILDARALLERAQAAIHDAQAAHRELVLKISLASPPPVPNLPPDAGRELMRITDLAAHRAWPEARRALADWTAASEALLEQARQALASNRAPIETRNQLRALLDAYRVKAQRLGLLEAPELQVTFERARRVLYTAPTDLAQAAQLVRSYQNALDANRSVPEATP